MNLLQPRLRRRGQCFCLVTFLLLLAYSTPESQAFQILKSTLPDAGPGLATVTEPVRTAVDLPLELRPRPQRETQAPERRAPVDPTTVRFHTVRTGDSLWSISRAYGVNLSILMENNQISRGRILRPGQTLAVTNSKGVYYKVQRGQTLASVCQDFGVSLGDVAAANQVTDVRAVQSGAMVFLPGARARRSSVFFLWPLQGRLSSTYGWRRNPLGGWGKDHHDGIDVAAPIGRPIAAAKDGTVVWAAYQGGYGRCIEIDHGDGYKTVYGHASKLLVRKGAEVKQGDTIALVGTSGRSTGPHLHFEIRRNGKPLDPLAVLPKSK